MLSQPIPSDQPERAAKIKKGSSRKSQTIIVVTQSLFPGNNLFQTPASLYQCGCRLSSVRLNSQTAIIISKKEVRISTTVIHVHFEYCAKPSLWQELNYIGPLTDVQFDLGVLDSNYLTNFSGESSKTIMVRKKSKKYKHRSFVKSPRQALSENAITRLGLSARASDRTLKFK